MITLARPQGPKKIELTVENAGRVMQKINGLIQYVSKSCFVCRGADAARIKEVVQSLSGAIANACSRIFGPISIPQEELDLMCLQDPEVRSLAVELEGLVAKVRGRIAKHCNLKNILGREPVLND